MILRPATAYDAMSLAPRLREQDLEEIAHGSGAEPLSVLKNALRTSTFSQAITTDSGLVVALWGVVPLSDRQGSIWMLGAPEIEQVSLPFLRACRPSVDAMHAEFPELLCASWHRNELHHRWLRWLGFEQVGDAQGFHFYRHV